MADDDRDQIDGERPRNIRPVRSLAGSGRGGGGSARPPSGDGFGLDDLGIPRLWLLVAAALALLVVGYSGFTARVDAGEACAVTRFGGLARESGPGLALKLPFVEQYHCYQTATTFYEVLDDSGRSQADFASDPLDGVTRDGQPITLTFNVRYRIPAQNVNEIYSQIGRTDARVNERVVVFHSRSIVRQIVQQYSSAELYSGDLAGVSQRMQDELAPLFEQSYVVLEYFEIKRPRFQEAYEEAIGQKQIALERIETAANEAEVAEQEAIRAANVAQGESNAQRIRAEGEAEAIRLRGQAVRDNPEIIQLNYIDALRTINWAILDSGEVTQFLEVTPPAGGAGGAGGAGTGGTGTGGTDPAATSPTPAPSPTTPPAPAPTSTPVPTQDTTP